MQFSRNEFGDLRILNEDLRLGPGKLKFSRLWNFGEGVLKMVLKSLNQIGF